MPSTSPVRSNPDGHVKLDRYFTLLIAKYSSNKKKLFNAKDKLQEQNLDLKSLRKLEYTMVESWSIRWGIVDKIKCEIKEF